MTHSLAVQSIVLVSEVARVGFKTAFAFEAVESLLNCQHAASQHESFFLIKAINAPGNEASTYSVGIT